MTQVKYVAAVIDPTDGANWLIGTFDTQVEADTAIAQEKLNSGHLNVEYRVFRINVNDIGLWWMANRQPCK